MLQKMSLTELLQKVLENIDRLRTENEDLTEKVATQAQQITQIEEEKAVLEGEVQRLLLFELEVCLS